MPPTPATGPRLQTAFQYAIAHHYDGLVTMDCDGQHQPDRIPLLLEQIDGADIVSGSRYLREFRHDTPPPNDRRFINATITAEINERFGLAITDAFCGFKAYRREALQQLNIRERGWGMPLEVWVQAAKLGLRIREVGVPRRLSRSEPCLWWRAQRSHGAARLLPPRDRRRGICLGRPTCLLRSDLPVKRLAAPTVSGEFLAEPGFESVPALVESNRKRLDAAFGDLRRLFRHNFSLPDGPVILTGHQPELFHPGVWIKTFAAAGLANRLGGTAINLVVDTDTLKSAAIRLPQLGATPDDVKLATLPFDDFDGETPYESRPVKNPSLFASFGDRLRDATHDWPFEPCGIRAFGVFENLLDSISQMALGYRIDFLTRGMDCEWGGATGTLPVNELGRMGPFGGFVERILERVDEFRETYNAAIRGYRRRHRLRSRNHPAAELEPDELPFWTMDGPRRRRTWQREKPDVQRLRPKALILTLYARLILSDFFIHGLGGGKYDEVTDDIIRNFFRIEPPAYQILTGTLHLPLPTLPTAIDDVRRLKVSQHRNEWNPHRLLANTDRDIEEENHRRIASWPTDTHEARSRRYREFRKQIERLRPIMANRLEEDRHRLILREQEVAVNTILQRRDYAWILYPESVLKPFLQRFLQR